MQIKLDVLINFFSRLLGKSLKKERKEPLLT
jgi:hypothetical protein